MSIFLDKKYLGLVSPKLKLYKAKGNDIFTFRCPFCGDSKKSKTKTRGYVFSKKNDLYFKCFNCSRSHTFGTFLKHVDPSLYKPYNMDRFKNENSGKIVQKKTDSIDQYKTVSKFTKTDQSINKILKISRISELPKEHFARVYVEEFRKIPQQFLSKLYYAPNFKDFVKTLLPDTKLNLPADQRLIIPFHDKNGTLLAVQGRALTNNQLRYITVKMKEEYPKIFGLDRVNFNQLVYVLEGPIDSMFVRNSIAAAGGDLPTNLNPENCVFLFDNEPRSKETVRKMERIIKKGFKIVIWPSNIRSKDINEFIQNRGGALGKFWSINDFLPTWTFTGLEAQMKFNMWRKV